MKQILIAMVFFCFPSLVWADVLMLQWSPPTTNENGTTLTDGDHFVVYHNGVALQDTVSWDTPQVEVDAVHGDSFYVVAVDSADNQSQPSNTLTYIDTVAPSAPSLLHWLNNIVRKWFSPWGLSRG